MAYGLKENHITFNGNDKSVIPSMEFYDNPEELIVELIHRIADIEGLVLQLQERITNLENAN